MFRVLSIHCSFWASCAALLQSISSVEQPIAEDACDSFIPSINKLNNTEILLGFLTLLP